MVLKSKIGSVRLYLKKVFLAKCGLSLFVSLEKILGCSKFVDMVWSDEIDMKSVTCVLNFALLKVGRLTSQKMNVMDHGKK